MATDSKERQSPWVLIFIFLFLIASFFIISFLYYQYQQQRIIREKQNELGAIADLKIWQIAQWRNERLNDAEVISENTLITHQVQAFFRSPNDAGKKKEVSSWLRSFHKHSEYQASYLFDTLGNLRLTELRGTTDSLIPDIRPYMKNSTWSRRAILTDMQRSNDLSKVHLLLIAPFLTDNQKDTAVAGILVLRIDPGRRLFPLVLLWPTPSRSSETLIVERDSSNVIYLNELRHQKNTTSTLRLPLSMEDLPAAMAVRGKEGIVEGKDYRGIPVLAALRQIADTPWFMISKVDQDEIYAPLQFQVWTIIGTMITLILASGMILGLWWRNQRVLSYKRQIQAKAERLALLKHFEYLVMYANDIFVLTDNTMAIVEVNDRAVETYGYTHDEMLTLNARDLLVIPLEDFPEHLKRDIVSDGATFETLHRKKDGSTFPVELSVRRIHVEEKEYYQEIIRDITERKQAESILRESEEKFRTFAEQSPNMIFINHGGRVVYVNAKCEEQMEYTKEEFYSPDFSFLQLTTPEYLPVLHEAFAKHMNGEDLPAYEYTLLTKSKKRIDVIITTKLIPYENGKAILGIITDITKRKEAEQQLQESEDRYRSLVEHSPDAIAVYSEGKFVYVNPATVKLIGAANESQLIGLPVMNIIHPDDAEMVRKRVLTAMKERIALPPMEEKMVRLDGSVIEVEVTSLPTIFKGKPATQVVTRDITEQKRLQTQFFQSQKIQSIGTLAGGIAHDFNNILAIILGYSSTLEKYRNDSQRHAEGLTAIEQAIERGAALVRQILTFARKTEIAFEPVNISEIIHELFLMLKQTFPKTVTFIQSISPETPSFLADRTQIHQSLLNLCVNARDAMPNGGTITIRTKRCTKDEVAVRFPTADQPAYVCISIIDTGVGMDKETYTRVFDPFFTTKEKGKGTGLGLSVVYGVMQSHHGFVDVESRIGEGTIFSLFFPIQEIMQPLTGEPQSDRGLPAGGTETILLVEDEFLILKALRKQLKSHGYQIYVAADGEEAIDVYLRHGKEIDVVLSDIGLPKISGTDVFKKLKEINPSINVILASGFFDPELKYSLQQDGVKAFIQKPYSTTEILRRLREVLDKTSAEDPQP